MEGVDLDRVAHPIGGLAVDAGGKAGHLDDLAVRLVVARQPLRRQQDQVAGLVDRDGFMDADDAARRVGGIDIDMDGAGREGHVLGGRQGRRHRLPHGGIGLRRVLSEGWKGDAGCNKRENTYSGAVISGFHRVRLQTRFEYIGQAGSTMAK